MDELLENSDAELHNIDAKDTCPSVSNPIEMKKFLPNHISDCGGFAETLRLAKGARAMLLRNINQTDGLTNGTMGVIDSFQFDRYGDLSAVKILFDAPWADMYPKRPDPTAKKPHRQKRRPAKKKLTASKDESETVAKKPKMTRKRKTTKTPNAETDTTAKRPPATKRKRSK